MLVLIQFVLRLSFGLAAAMAFTPAGKVTSGFYRNHLYVLLGLNALAAAAALGTESQVPAWPALAAAALSYVGAVAWLYEKRTAGLVLLVLVAAVSLCGAWLTLPALSSDTSIAASTSAKVLSWLDPATGGLVLGVTIAAMFLGHWYLNTPTMELAPLKRLVTLMALVVLARAAVCGTGLGLTLASMGPPDAAPPDAVRSAAVHSVVHLDAAQWIFVALRWLAGIAAALGVAVMTWQTLKIPNTQAATGLLYVGVIVTFLGELTAMLLSAGSPFPL